MIEQLVTETIHWIYESYGRVPASARQGFDRDVRHPEWTRWMLNELGSPDREMYNVAVTGSKGKGSHAILMAGILQAAGLRVGLFTSPHLVDFLERLRIDGQAIDGESFVRLAKTVRSVMDRAPLPSGQYIGPVGILAVMASLWFQASQTDVNIFELGRGAKWDDVNQVQHSGAVITPIFAEHLDKLGPTWADVVDEKLAVVTTDVGWAVSHEQAEIVRERWTRNDASERVSWRQLGRDFTFRVKQQSGATVVEVTDGKRKHRALISAAVSPLAGNAAVALIAASKVLDDLRGVGQELDIDLRNLVLPGRMQVIRRRPLCLVDGTIHAVNAKIVARWLEGRAEPGRVTVILSLPDDKDAQGVMETIAPFCSRMVLTESTNSHLHYSRNLTDLAKRFVADVRADKNVERVIADVCLRADPDDTYLFLGTQSYVGDVLRVFDVETKSIWQCSDID